MGFLTHLDGDHSYVEHRCSGRRLPIERIGKTYYMKVRLRVGHTVGAIGDVCLEEPRHEDGHPEAAGSGLHRPGAEDQAVVRAEAEPPQREERVLISRHATVGRTRARLKELHTPVLGHKGTVS